ncbi:MAG: hypothetical protein OXF99_08560 [bacterium]|nr:hypothetical protein [bacterium]
MKKTSCPKKKLVGAILAIAVVVTGLLSASPAASGQSDSDVERLDRLIAEQWVLVNAYRCRFEVDLRFVPGGCLDGKPASPELSSFTFIGRPLGGDVAKLEGLVAAQQALLRAYRCWFQVDLDLVPDRCGEGGDTGEGGETGEGGDTGDGGNGGETGDDGGETGGTAHEPGWNAFDGFEYNHPDLDRPRQIGVLIESITSDWLAEGVKAELRVACFYFDGEGAGTLRGYINWNTFITSRVGIYDLELEFSDGQDMAFDAVNSTINEASIVFGAAHSAQFAQSIMDSDGLTVTASVFIPFGGWTVSATFDLSGSANAVQSVRDSCHAGAAQ